jgi:hypothetical protein
MISTDCEVDRAARIDETAALLGFSRVTIHKYLAQGKLARFGRITSRVSCRSIRDFLGDPGVRLADIQKQAQEALVELRKKKSPSTST